MPAPVFNPPDPPSFGFVMGHAYRVESVGTSAGYDRTQILHGNPLRRARVEWKACTQANVHYVLDFFRRRSGGKVFSYTPPVPTVDDPVSEGPEVDQVAGGALAQRTYYVVFTWRVTGGGGETVASPDSSLVVNANNLVTVKAPLFPIGVDAFGVYASETQGAEEFQAEVSNTRLWTEPVGGLISGVSPPATSNATAPILFRLASTIEPRLFTRTTAIGARYNLELDFDEQFFE